MSVSCDSCDFISIWEIAVWAEDENPKAEIEPYTTMIENSVQESVAKSSPARKLSYPNFYAYSNSDCAGAELEVTLNSGTTSVNLSGFGAIGNDNLSSILVPTGYAATLYNNHHYGGSTLNYCEPPGTLPCQNVESWMNNRASSMKITFTGTTSDSSLQLDNSPSDWQPSLSDESHTWGLPTYGVCYEDITDLIFEFYDSFGV